MHKKYQFQKVINNMQALGKLSRHFQNLPSLKHYILHKIWPGLKNGQSLTIINTDKWKENEENLGQGLKL